MPVKKKSSPQICICILTFGACMFFFNLVVLSYFGMTIEDSPEHLSPFKCFQDKYQFCTTKEGECTYHKKSCTFPKTNESCTYALFTNKLKDTDEKQMKKDIKSMMMKKKKTKSKQKKDKKKQQSFKKLRKIYQNYCADENVKLYLSIRESLFTPKRVLESVLTAILLFIFYPQIEQLRK